MVYLQNQADLPGHLIPASDTTVSFQGKLADTLKSLLGLKLWNPSFHSLITSFAALWKYFLKCQVTDQSPELEGQ